MKVLITIPLEASERGARTTWSCQRTHHVCHQKVVSDAVRSNQPRPKVNYFTAKIIDFIALMKASKQTESGSAPSVRQYFSFEPLRDVVFLPLWTLATWPECLRAGPAGSRRPQDEPPAFFHTKINLAVVSRILICGRRVQVLDSPQLRRGKQGLHSSHNIRKQLISLNVRPSALLFNPFSWLENIKTHSSSAISTACTLCTGRIRERDAERKGVRNDAVAAFGTSISGTPLWIV